MGIFALMVIAVMYVMIAFLVLSVMIQDVYCGRPRVQDAPRIVITAVLWPVAVPFFYLIND